MTRDVLKSYSTDPHIMKSEETVMGLSSIGRTGPPLSVLILGSGEPKFITKHATPTTTMSAIKPIQILIIKYL